MKRLIFIFLPLASLLFLIAGCDKLSSSKSDSPVLAKIESSVITEEDFLKEMERVPEWAKNQFSDMEGKKKFLDELVKRDLIYQQAVKMKLENDSEYLSKVEEFKKMTLVSSVLKKEVEDKAVVDEAEVKDFFDKNADKLTVGAKINASHILVETEKEADDITAKLDKGENFGSLAKKYSKDKGSAEKGGNLGFFTRGQMVPEFENAALGLTPGQVSKPVKTRFGFHIIKLMDIQKGEPANFEQSKESIQRQLIVEKRKNLFDQFVDKLRTDMKVTTNEETLAKVTLPWEKPADAPEAAEPVTEKK